jgi:uncharacterized protein YeaO (DUF488 family)
MIKIKRIYESIKKDDGFRILIDGLWPRGISKKEAKIDLWLKEIGVSTELRKWFSHDPNKWNEFKRKFFEELDAKKDSVDILKKIVKEKNNVTLLYSSKEERYNNAVALCEYLCPKNKKRKT